MNAPSAVMRPAGPVDVVLDTDTYNEIDDQFALAYLLKSSPMLRTQAVYAAPFSDPSRRFGNFKSDAPAYGMEKSYCEILKILSLCGREDLSACVFRGSARYLADERTPVESAAALDLAQRAMSYTPEHPLYVVGIAAATDIASALLLKPAIRDRIVVVWLGGNAHTWPHNLEFNSSQDIAAARVLFNSGVPLVQLPCMGVVSAFTTSGPELTHWLSGRNPLCDYLLDTVLEEMKDCHGVWSRPIWDVAAIAWLLSGDFTPDRIVPAPLPEYDDTYSFGPCRPPIRYVFHIQRDAVFSDLFRKLTETGKAAEPLAETDKPS